MREKGISLAAIILLSTTSLVQAQEGELSVILDVTYVSRYLDRGFDAYPDDHSAIQPSIDVDLYGTGFGFNIWHSRANRSGFENAEELIYTLYYYNSLFEGERYATDYKIGWAYYSHPDQPPRAADLQKIFASFSWPKICHIGIVPRYTAISMWPSQKNSTMQSNFSGWAHVFGLGFDLAAPSFNSRTAEQILHLSAEAWYNDGLGGTNVDHDWSHANFGVSTDLPLTKNLTFTPGIYHQLSMDDSVNKEDETWISLSMKYRF